MIYFLDASAMVKKYIVEPGTERLRALITARRRFAIGRVSQVEVPAALARRARNGDLKREIAQRHAAQFEQDVASMQVVEMRPAVLALARQLVWEHPLRAYDALQLAGALQLKRMSQIPVTFVGADGPLCDAARDEALKVERLG